ncbi:MAG: serine/threonine-protein kinase [candidate division Zixibacteria bacterium]|nr:serine/threonine-protein kinase [candidate division Zixibacteria bacterium]
MDSARWQQIKHLFEQASAMPSTEQQAFLNRACGHDSDMLAEVQSLLEADNQPHSLMGGSAASRYEELLEDDLTGQRVGVYQVLRRLASGGMGAVYLAERADGQFVQQVALKVIKRGMDSEDILARFTAERQILAQLDHPNIARLIDGGITDSGQPYFTMEYVDGIPLTEYCDRERLTVDQRLELVATVCDAVQSAHQNLVVHRDLKPSNIMVDRAGKVKLVDFGIAKVLGQNGGGVLPESMTRTGVAIMTPGYASPEQIRGEGVTTVSDVYSLGVVLCELLTGRRPHDLDGLGPDQIARVVGTQAPTRPSVLITGRSSDDKRGTSALERISQLRGTDPYRLRRSLSGDLDNICLMALRSEPERRYPSVALLREDIQRYRQRLPVVARPDTLVYRLQKFVSRYRAAVAAALVVIVAVAGLTGIYLVQLSDERDLARSERDKARQVSEYLVSLFESADPNESKGEEITARQLLDIGVERVDRELRDQPTVQAMMLSVIGTVYIQLGALEESRDLHLRALDLNRAVYGPRHAEVARSLRSLGTVYYDYRTFDTAAWYYQQALDIDREVYGGYSDEVAEDLTSLASSLRHNGDLVTAEKYLRQALKIRRELHPGNDPGTAYTLNHLGRLYWTLGDNNKAEPLLREGLAMRIALLGEDNFETIASRGSLASVLTNKGDLEGSAELYRVSLTSLQRLVGNDHYYVAGMFGNLAHVLRRQKNFAAADSLFHLSYEIMQRQVEPPNVRLASPVLGLGMVQLENGNPQGAESLLVAAVETYRQVLPRDHPTLAEAECQLGRCLTALGGYDDAEALLTHSFTVFRDARGVNHSSTQTAFDYLSELFIARGEPERIAEYRAPSTGE